MFSWAVSVCRRFLPAGFRQTLGEILFGVAPKIPVSFISTLSQKAPKIAFVHGAVIAFFFCFVVTTMWTLAVGTFRGTDPQRMYYSDDYGNIINYLLLCPLYVGLSAALIVLSCQSWSGLNDDPQLYPRGGTRPAKMSLSVALFIIVGVALAVTCNYIVESLDPNIYPKVSWYISGIDATGQRFMGGLGVYFTLLNYTLLLICIAGFIAFLLSVAVGAEVGRNLRAPATTAPASFDMLREKLADFVSAYVVAKAFVAVLMLNAFTWKWAAPQHSINFSLLGVVLSLAGLFFVSFPRYYIELEWYLLTMRRAQAIGAVIPQESEDLRSGNVRIFAHVLDTVLIGGFFFSFWFS